MVHFQDLHGATPLDPDEMDGLKRGHITTREELNRFEQDNINEALQWLANRRKGEFFTEKFVRTLHRKMFGKVWKWAGSFRKSDKNIGVGWHQIAEQLYILLQDVQHWIKHKTYREDEIAVRFHHKLVWIHLFPNGNGRHARLMTDMLIEEILKQEPFTWRMGGAEEDDEVRELYIQALKKADEHDYSALLNFLRPDSQ